MDGHAAVIHDHLSTRSEAAAVSAVLRFTPEALADDVPGDVVDPSWSLLLEACSVGSEAVVRALLALDEGDPLRSASLLQAWKASKPHATGPLFLAANAGFDRVVRALLDAGSDPLAREGPGGLAPLDGAARSGQHDAACVLLSRARHAPRADLEAAYALARENGHDLLASTLSDAWAMHDLRFLVLGARLSPRTPAHRSFLASPLFEPRLLRVIARFLAPSYDG